MSDVVLQRPLGDAAVMARKKAPQKLSQAEEQTWRALVRLLVTLPRSIDADLSRRTDLTLTQYVVLMRLSESPGRSLRMSQLADAATMSPSRMTRIIQAMVTNGWVERRTVPGDGRGSMATLTSAGMSQLKAAWPHHLAGVREVVFDHIDPKDLDDLQRILERLLTGVLPDPGEGCE